MQFNYNLLNTWPIASSNKHYLENRIKGTCIGQWVFYFAKPDGLKLKRLQNQLLLLIYCTWLNANNDTHSLNLNHLKLASDLWLCRQLFFIEDQCKITDCTATSWLLISKVKFWITWIHFKIQIASCAIIRKKIDINAQVRS